MWAVTVGYPSASYRGPERPESPGSGLSHFREMLMNCIDCDAPSGRYRRCLDCREEVAETPEWAGLDVWVCLRCSGDFVRPPRGRWQPYCPPCAQAVCLAAAADREAWRTARAAHLASTGGNCLEPECTKTAEKRGYCGAHYQKRCRPNRSHGPDDRFRQWAKAKAFDPAEEKRRLREKNDRRRVQKRGGGHERVDRQRVFERDGYRCFCGKPLDMTKVAPHHPLAPTIDHIVPLSKGGDHNYANVRAAHFACNVRRGNRGGNEQLALI